MGVSGSGPAVDVVVPTFDGLPHLRTAVESVLGQTYSDLKLLVVDDGSTDGTAEYVASLRDPRVTYLWKRNGGPASARNRGLSASTAPLVAFLDADDVWYSDKLERQVAVLRGRPKVGLVHGFHHTIDEDGRMIGSREDGLRGRVFDALLDGNKLTGSCSVVLIRRAALEAVGPFREDLRSSEDWELWLRVTRRFEVDHVPDYLAAIRVRDAALQADRRQMARGHLELFPILVDELPLAGEDRRRVARACVFRAAHEYHAAGDGQAARTALVHYLREDPWALGDVSRWQEYALLFLGEYRARAAGLGRRLVDGTKALGAGRWGVG